MYFWLTAEPPAEDGDAGDAAATGALRGLLVAQGAASGRVENTPRNGNCWCALSVPASGALAGLCSMRMTVVGGVEDLDTAMFTLVLFRSPGAFPNPPCPKRNSSVGQLAQHPQHFDPGQTGMDASDRRLCFPRPSLGIFTTIGSVLSVWRSRLFVGLRGLSRATHIFIVLQRHSKVLVASAFIYYGLSVH